MASFLTTHRRELSSPIKGTLALHCQVARLVSESFLMLGRSVSSLRPDAIKILCHSRRTGLSLPAPRIRASPRKRRALSEKSGVAVESVSIKRKAEPRKTLCENPKASAKRLRFDIWVFPFYRWTGNAGAYIRSGLSEKPNVSGAGSTRLPSLERS